MALFKDFNHDWVEIFRAGDYGYKGKFSTDDLDKMVMNLVDWKPPAVLGHPETDSPAMGWVSRMKREGDVLFALFEKVQPDLEEHVKSGRYPNRSIAIYKNPKGTGPAVRHIGFLGATPPEVKGLAPIQFKSSDGDFVAIEFKEDDLDPNEVKKTIAAEIRAFFTGMFGEKRQESATFSQADMDAAVAKATNPLAEQIKALATKFDDSVKTAGEKSAAVTAEAKKAEVASFIKARQSANQWVPAFSEAGMDRILEHLALNGGTVKFGEAGKEKEVGLYELACNFFEALPKIVPTVELVKGAKKAAKVIQFTEAKGIGLDQHSVLVNARAEEIAAELRKQDPKLTEAAAFSEGMRQANREIPASAGGVAAGAV